MVQRTFPAQAVQSKGRAPWLMRAVRPVAVFFVAVSAVVCRLQGHNKQHEDSGGE